MDIILHPLALGSHNFPPFGGCDLIFSQDVKTSVLLDRQLLCVIRSHQSNHTSLSFFRMDDVSVFPDNRWMTCLYCRITDGCESHSNPPIEGFSFILCCSDDFYSFQLLGDSSTWLHCCLVGTVGMCLAF